MLMHMENGYGYENPMCGQNGMCKGANASIAIRDCIMSHVSCVSIDEGKYGFLLVMHDKCPLMIFSF